MPPKQTLVERANPTHFSDCVVVIGLSEAIFRFTINHEKDEIKNPNENLMYIPSGIRHSVVNEDEDRV